MSHIFLKACLILITRSASLDALLKYKSNGVFYLSSNSRSSGSGLLVIAFLFYFIAILPCCTNLLRYLIDPYPV